MAQVKLRLLARKHILKVLYPELRLATAQFTLIAHIYVDEDKRWEQVEALYKSEEGISFCFHRIRV